MVAVLKFALETLFWLLAIIAASDLMKKVWSKLTASLWKPKKA